MILAFAATAIVILALMWEVGWPTVSEQLEHRRARRARVPALDYDPGRERRGHGGPADLPHQRDDDDRGGCEREDHARRGPARRIAVSRRPRAGRR